MRDHVPNFELQTTAPLNCDTTIFLLFEPFETNGCY
jgi:hypothetical protein